MSDSSPRRKLLRASSLAALVAVTFTSCCGGPNVWHGHQGTREPQAKPPSSPPQMSQTPPVVGIEYKRYGHETTTYVVARIAGWDPVHAMRFSHFSQAPDDLALRYSATAVAIWGIVPGLWGYRQRIMEVLHSLHGGDAPAVIKRRANLAALISRSADAARADAELGKDRSANDWETGFLIHAMADSYAHVKPGANEGEEVAYGGLVGHGFDCKVHPDHISAHFGTYRKYVTSLHAALAIDGGDPEELGKFLTAVEKAATQGPEAGREKAVENAIREYRPYQTGSSGTQPYEYSDFDAAEYAGWDGEIKGVNGFLKRIGKQLK